jgi:hypothetical protein
MNFQTVQNLATSDEKATLFGTLKEFKGGGLTANGKPFAKVSITDDLGVTKNCKLYGTLPQVQQVGQRLQFSIGWYDYEYQGKTGRAFAGFWNDKATVLQTPAMVNQTPQVSTQPPQATQRAPQSTTRQEPDWDSKDMRIAYQCFRKAYVEAACNGLCKLEDVHALCIAALSDMYSLEIASVKGLRNLNKPSPFQGNMEDNPALDDEVPF